jgi:hypothetical protein
MRFVEAGGTAVIASLTEVVPAMAGEAGTRIVPEAGTGRKTERTAGHAAEKSTGKRHGKKADSKKAPAKKATTRKAAQPGTTVIDIDEARKRASGGRA